MVTLRSCRNTSFSGFDWFGKLNYGILDKILSFVPYEERSNFILMKQDIKHDILAASVPFTICARRLPLKVWYMRERDGRFEFCQVKAFRYGMREQIGTFQMELKFVTRLWVEDLNRMVSLVAEEGRELFLGGISVSCAVDGLAGRQILLRNTANMCRHGRLMHMCNCRVEWPDAIFREDLFHERPDVFSGFMTCVKKCWKHFYRGLSTGEKRVYPFRRCLSPELPITTEEDGANPGPDETHQTQIEYRPARTLEEWQRFVPGADDAAVEIKEYDLQELPWYAPVEEDDGDDEDDDDDNDGQEGDDDHDDD